MKVKAIKFFSPEENIPAAKKATSTQKLTGYISGLGKLVIPSKVLEELGIEPETTSFKIGTQEGKRTLKYLYLIPSTDQEGTFSPVKTGRGYSIPLEIILRKGGIDFENVKYTFTISPFDYEEGIVGFELALVSSEAKKEYTGKPRGRKPNAESVTE